MDLWIRSQDKQVLRRCNSLKIEKWNDYYVIVEQATVYGKYKTKESALKVLNNIHAYIYTPQSYFDEKDLLSRISMSMSKIYIMPEDSEDIKIPDNHNHVPFID